jgi:integrase
MEDGMPLDDQSGIKLTKRAIDLLETRPGKNYIVFDDELPCFGVRVMPSGKRFFLIQYRFQGRTRRVMLGMYGPVTPEQARRQAMILLGQVKAGIDPAEQRDSDRMAGTIAELGKRFLDQYVSTRCKPSTAAEYKRSVEMFINPKLGTKRLASLTRADISQLHFELRHIPYQANRTLGVLSKMLNLAEEWGLRPDGSNPCRHVKKYKESKRERFLTGEEIAKLGAVLDTVETSGEESRAAVACIRLLLLTGCRLNEIQTLKWEHVDLPSTCLRLPDSKTGAKVVHIGQTVIDVLNGIERVEDNPYVIIGTLPQAHLTDMQKPWRRIRKLASLPEVRIHDLRHTFASAGLTVGEGLPMIGKLLGHTQVQTTARYAHLATDPIKAAAERVSERLGTFLVKNRDATTNSPTEQAGQDRG